MNQPWRKATLQILAAVIASVIAVATLIAGMNTYTTNSYHNKLNEYSTTTAQAHFWRQATGAEPVADNSTGALASYLKSFITESKPLTDTETTYQGVSSALHFPFFGVSPDNKYNDGGSFSLDTHQAVSDLEYSSDKTKKTYTTLPTKPHRPTPFRPNAVADFIVLSLIASFYTLMFIPNNKDQYIREVTFFSEFNKNNISEGFVWKIPLLVINPALGAGWVLYMTPILVGGGKVKIVTRIARAREKQQAINEHPWPEKLIEAKSILDAFDAMPTPDRELPDVLKARAQADKIYQNLLRVPTTKRQTEARLAAAQLLNYARKIQTDLDKYNQDLARRTQEQLVGLSRNQLGATSDDDDVD